VKIKKKYTVSNKRTIWRLLPSGGKLLIEERDEKNKQVFFNCIDIETGKEIISDFQTDEKFWVGVEAFENDMIYFHKFAKPDMPGHIGITVYGIGKKTVLWSSDNLIFLFLFNKQVFAFIQKFESRDYFSLDAETGDIIKEYGEDVNEVNNLREKSLDVQNEKYKNYIFPDSYIPGRFSPDVEKIIEKKRKSVIISGSVECAEKNKSAFLSYHTVDNNGKLENHFNIIDISSGKVILELLLNQGIASYIPDSFFLKDSLLFLIKDKNELLVYSVE